MRNSPYRIAVLSMHSSPMGTIGQKDTGGMSIYLQELSRELGALGWQLDLFTRSTRAGENGKVERLSKNVRLVHVKAGPQQSVPKETLPRYLPQFQEQLERFRKGEGVGYDLLFSHYWISGLAGEGLRRSWKVPHLVMFHTLGAAKNEAGVGRPEPSRRLEAEKELAQNCSGVIVPTEREKKKLVSACGASPSRVWIIPCGVNLERFYPRSKNAARNELGLERGEQVALFVGRPDPVKGLELLLHALALLPPGSAPLRLVVVGDHEGDKARLQELCRALELRAPVHFAGTVEHSRLPFYHSAADLCLVPSYYESFGLTALEALACGTPVVAADVGGLREIIRQGETGHVVRRGSAAELAEKIERALRELPRLDPAVIRESVYGYSWQAVARQVNRGCLALLEAAAAERSPGRSGMGE